MDHGTFISYSSSDREAADRVCQALEAAGASCWIAPRDIPAGSVYAKEIVDAIRGARAVVLILSAQANRSQWVTREIERAVHHRCSILTFRIEPVIPSPELELFLSTQQWLDGASALAANDFTELLQAVTRLPRGEDAPEASEPLRPVRTTRRTNLPGSLTSFVGRESLIASAGALLNVNRLVTLTGSGGSGKTRLALEVAARRLTSALGDAWFVDLSTVTDGTLLAREVASVLEVREQPQKTPAESVFEHLAARPALLLLDNCEQVLTASAKFCKELLAKCPQVRVLATSRAPLSLTGEAVWPVPALTVFDPRRITQVSPAIIEDLMATEAVRLFVERARSQRPDFAVTEENALAIAQVCRRLDGLPLAIELAASRARVLSPQQISEKLDDRFRLLRGGDKTAPERQQTLQAALDWSYDLLSEQECVLLARLSIFSGGWTLEAAEQICSADTLEDWEVLDYLASLVDKCMVVAQDSEFGMGYRLLETIREYALQRLENLGETAMLRARHGIYFAGLAHQARAQIRGPRQQAWTRTVDRDRDNLHSALAWCHEASDPNALASFLRDLWPFWYRLGRYSEGLTEIERALSRIVAPPATQAWANVLNGAGALSYSQGRFTAARGFYERAVEMQRRLGDREAEATTLSNFGLVALDEGDDAAASEAWRKSLEIQKELGDEAGMALTLNNLALIPFNAGNYQAARPLFEESRVLSIKLEDNSAAMICLTNLGLISCYEGALEAAKTLHQDALNIADSCGDQAERARALHNLAEVALFQADLTSASAYQEDSLLVSQEIGDASGEAESLAQRAEIALKNNDATAALRDARAALEIALGLGEARLIVRVWECGASVAGALNVWRSAALLLGCAEARREADRMPLEPIRRLGRDTLVQDASAGLGPDVFAVARQEGRALDAGAAQQILNTLVPGS